jgi:hypothetical protein
VIVPPLSALLADSSWKMICDLGPLLGSIKVYQVQE